MIHANGIDIEIYTEDFQNEYISITDIARYKSDNPTAVIQNWIDSTDAIGIVSKSGRYGGTFAHSDIALEFASWISPEFKLYIIKDYKRLKSDENSRLSLNWNLNRELSKLNYRIHTDAIKANLIPPELTTAQIFYTYASVGEYGKL